MSIEITQTIVYTILMGIMPVLSALISFLGFKVNDTKFTLFGFLLIMPSMIIILSLIK